MKTSTEKLGRGSWKVIVALIAEKVRMQLGDTDQTLVVGYVYKYDRLVAETGSLSSLMQPGAYVEVLKLFFGRQFSNEKT